MARIRTVKPQFFRHYEMFKSEVSEGLPLRLAFIGLWCVADREGRFKWVPEELKIECLPYDDVDFSRVLDALATRGFIVKYRVGTRVFGWIPGFSRHQVVNNRESKSELPSPDEGEEITSEINTLTREARVADASSTRKARGQRGREGKGKEGKESSVPKGTAASAANGVDEEAGEDRGGEPDVKRAVYDAGKRMLGRSSGGQITKAIARIGLGSVAEVLDHVRREQPIDARAYFEKSVAARAANTDQPGRPSEGYGCF